MVMLLHIYGVGVRDMTFALQPDKTYTIGSVVDVDIRINADGVADQHAQIRYEPRTGECTLKCLKEFTPPETSGLWLQNENREMDMITETETILRNGSDFTIGNSWANVCLMVLDPTLLIKDNNDLQYRIADLELQLGRARGEINDLNQELRGEQLRRKRVEEELRVLREEGEASRMEKRRK
jgi:hypothetical protein